MADRNPARTALLGAIVLVVIIAGGELLFRVALPAPWQYPRDPPEDALLAPHPVRGYALRSDLTRRWARPDFDVEVRTSDQGLRDRDLAAVLETPLRVLAVGDSYTFGIGVEVEDTWPEQLERLLGGPAAAAVVNAGVPGYSARQMRQAAEELGPAIEPQVIIAALYANSFWRVDNPYRLHGGTLIAAQQATAVEITPDGDLITTAFAPGTPLRRVDVFLKRYSHFGAHVLSLVNRGYHWPARPAGPAADADVRRAYASTLNELTALQSFAVAHGTRLIVLAVNAQQEDGSFLPVESLYNAILREHCERAGVTFVDPLAELESQSGGEPRFRRPEDAHWTPAAHEIAARMLEAAMRAVRDAPASGRRAPPA